LLAMNLGAGFVARSFSGDKAQLVPLIQAGLKYPGFALIDVLSPCVTFNDHDGSTKSYAFTREHYEPVVEADFVLFKKEIATDYAAGEAVPVMLHDGCRVVLRKLAEDYDPTDELRSHDYVQQHIAKGEYLTGLLHCRSTQDTEFHSLNRTPDLPLNQLPFERLNPGSKQLGKLMARYR